jgi:hypothetical protein
MENLYGVLEWRNEHSNNAYPLSSPLFIADLLVDANFVQFEGSLPVFKSLAVTYTVATLTLTIAAVDYAITLTKPSTDTYASLTSVKIYDNTDNYLGSLSFGVGLYQLFDRFVNTVHTINIPFLPICVNYLSGSAGVYSIAGVYGAVNFNTADNGVKHIFHHITDQQVEWNAVTVPPLEAGTALKTLNHKAPIENNIQIKDNPVLRFIPDGGGLSVKLATSLANVKILPTTDYA